MKKWIKNLVRLICGPKKMESKMFDMVREFNMTFGVSMYQNVNVSDWMLRLRLMREEVAEYEEACIDDNYVEVLDALIDQMYILIGTIQVHGLEDVFMEGFEEVHRSNMSKLDENGRPIYREDGKVIKGPNYFKPNLRNLIEL